MTQPARVVFSLDVDNTLLDNDRVIADLKRHQKKTLSAVSPERARQQSPGCQPWVQSEQFLKSPERAAKEIEDLLEELK